jgi:hypothetical protein
MGETLYDLLLTCLAYLAERAYIYYPDQQELPHDL